MKGFGFLEPFFLNSIVNIATGMREISDWEGGRTMKTEQTYTEEYAETPVEISIRYFEELDAPTKKLYLIPNAGHAPMIDNVEEYRIKKLPS